jgi:hypothetical protein
LQVQTEYTGLRKGLFFTEITFAYCTTNTTTHHLPFSATLNKYPSSPISIQDAKVVPARQNEQKLTGKYLTKVFFASPHSMFGGKNKRTLKMTRIIRLFIHPFCTLLSTPHSRLAGEKIMSKTFPKSLQHFLSFVIIFMQ